MEYFIGGAIGWTLGTAVMWAYFVFSGLIISREEYYKRRRK